jgi:hypothetical protein
MAVQAALKVERGISPNPRPRLLPAAADLPQMERPDLLKLWRQLFGTEPPRNVSAGFLIRALGHTLQLFQHGDVPPRVLKALRTIAEGKAPPAGSAAALRPGVCLMREWNGRTYRVEVVADGFRLDGRTYRSLSAIARHITGAQWSGPRFFGIG